MMDCNYSKVEIDAMVADLDINDSNQEQLRKKLWKFEMAFLVEVWASSGTVSLIISS